MGATALCLGVFVNGQTMVRSLGATVDSKAGVFVGGDVQVLVEYRSPQQDSFPFPITRSTRLHWAGELVPGGRSFDLVGVEAETLADAAYWHEGFADESLEELAARLPSDSGPLPIVLVQGGGEPTTIRTAQAEIPVQVIGRANGFPGVSSDLPAVVVDHASFVKRGGVQGNPFFSPNARTEYWIAGDPEQVLLAVSQLEAYPIETMTLEGVKDIPYIEAAINTFSMMNVIGLAVAMLLIGVLVVYIQARQRARAVSGVLSQRMGMRAGQARMAIAFELGSVLLASFVVGAALGSLAGALVVPLLDPLPMLRPDPLFHVPASLLRWAALGLAAVTALGAWLVQRRESSVHLGEVLRVVD
jgi:putative ABC transport system permease protein